MTWIELVKSYFPNVDDDYADFILWEKTAFPICGLEQVKEQLREYKESTK